MRIKLIEHLVPKQLYKKIWFAFFIIFAISSILQFNMLEYFFKRLTDEEIQIRYWNLAEEVVPQLNPFIEHEDLQGFLSHLDIIQRMHPKSEFIFLSEDGTQIVPLEKEGSNKLHWEKGDSSVSLPSLKEFLRPVLNRELPLYSSVDYRIFKRNVVFSAAPVQFPFGNGYLMISLRGGALASPHYESLRSRALIYGTIAWQFIVLFLAGGLGAIIFYFVTRRFNSLVATVNNVAEGDLNARVPEKGNDEISQLARQFNEMTATISANMDVIKENDRRRRDLIANISHDLRGPITCIQSYAEETTLSASTKPLERLLENNEVVLRNARMLRDLIDQLFELSKLEARETKPAFEPFSLLDVFTEEVIPKYQPLADEHQVSIVTQIPEYLSLVEGDFKMLYRVVSNLVENAIRYNNPEGEVRIELRDDEDRVEVTISDNGPGIKKEDLPHIFDRFYTGNKARTKGVSSTGLGLAIVKKILELHEQEITVESEEGVGTTFQFSLKTS